MSGSCRSGLLWATLLAALLGGACGADGPGGDATPAGTDAADALDTADRRSPPRRVLLIIADDLGVDQLDVYRTSDSAPASGHVYPTTPTLSGLCDSGVRFDFAWSAPTCSPTRATILTGRYGFRTGVGWAVAKKNQLKLSETTLPELLAPAGVATANVGKWHLGTDDDIGGLSAPNQAGWQHYAGPVDGVLTDYATWERTVDGETATSTTYATTANVDDALAFAQARRADEPWLLWVAFNAPHTPFHKPPNALHDSDGLSGAAAHVKKNPALYYRAMVQALDTEVGRLLSELKSRGQAPTDVVFVGDSGSPGQVAVAPWHVDKAKGSLYEGGVRVPLCVAGRAVTKPGVSGALVHTVDLFATLAGFFGVATGDAGQDSHDLAPLLADPSAAGRDVVYTESFGNPQGDPSEQGRAISDGTYKLIQLEDGSERLFHLASDRHEGTNLLASALAAPAKQAYDTLVARLATLK